MNAAFSPSIVYADTDFIAVDKPSGLLCVPGLHEPDNLFDLVKRDFPNARIVHRLDMATSGLVLFALHYEAQRALGKLFEQRCIEKHYIAEVDGQLDVAAGEIQSPLICDWPNRPRQKIDWLEGKSGLTFFSTLTYDTQRDSTRLKLSPHSGRTHQLRVHCWHIGHPILGDNLYHNAHSVQKAPRLLLHAAFLRFQHPLTKETLELLSPAPF